MMRKGIAAALLSGLMAVSGAAKAFTYDFGLLIGTETSPLVSVGSFVSGTDTFFFQLLGPTNVGAGASNVLISANPVFAFSSYGASLYDNTTNTLIPPPFTLTSTAASQNLSLSSVLGAGSYRIDVTGSAGSAGGAYIVSLSNNGAPVVVVPEPESYALFLAGLGLISTIAARRRRS